MTIRKLLTCVFLLFLLTSPVAVTAATITFDNLYVGQDIRRHDFGGVFFDALVSVGNEWRSEPLLVGGSGDLFISPYGTTNDIVLMNFDVGITQLTLRMGDYPTLPSISFDAWTNDGFLVGDALSVTRIGSSTLWNLTFSTEIAALHFMISDNVNLRIYEVGYESGSSPAPVPEPATAFLFLTGIGGFGGYTFLRRRVKGLIV